MSYSHMGRPRRAGGVNRTAGAEGATTFSRSPGDLTKPPAERKTIVSPGQKKAAPKRERLSLIKILTMSYSHMGRPHTHYYTSTPSLSAS
jgi:hypothetical protein